MEKVTGKQFFTTLSAGIWQSICWFCNLCGYKDKSLYGLFVKRVYRMCDHPNDDFHGSTPLGALLRSHEDAKVQLLRLAFREQKR